MAKLPWLLCLALSVTIHLAVAARFATDSDAGDAGSGGDGGASVSLALARPADLDAVVARWEAPPEADRRRAAMTPPDISAAPPVVAMLPDEPRPMPGLQAPAIVAQPMPPRRMTPPAPHAGGLRASPRPPPRADLAPARPSRPRAAATPSGRGGSDAAGRGSSEGASEDALRRTWAGQIRSAIARHHAVPAAARRQGIEGRVMLRVTVGADGALGSVSLRSGSRSVLLDDAALAAVRRAAPFPRAPRGVTAPATLDVPLNFALR